VAHCVSMSAHFGSFRRSSRPITFAREGQRPVQHDDADPPFVAALKNIQRRDIDLFPGHGILHAVLNLNDCVGIGRTAPGNRERS
jgi:hypothetical protein